MEDDENVVEGNTRGNEWEVVSLTASTYAAAPGPKEIESTDDDNDLTRTASQDENLTLEPDISKICSELGVKTESADKSSDENLKVKELSDVDDHNVIQFFDEKTDISGSTSFDKSPINPEECDPQKNLEASLDSLKSQDPIKEDRPDLPCEAWWKRQAASLYTHAKEANTFWSIMVAATLMGLVILGHRWQLQQLKWQFGVNDENVNRMFGPISRFKDVLVSGKQQGPVIHGRAPARR
ncbi:ATG8-interacting protein 1-like protein isoform X1 [Cinnamomum micranthum f. kanehirae]|uniref:ATG8-interacting protein 1-like protein isoform X1 n=1 Tax=Cinnamomum micranthum f. kanehirae TaxID=337451 RepID=A0A3S3Q4V7_9MAGN|nr:ATG8-interacting protein 1-like protein isoform X1 [Cinnamomum micranthum f. kanehirae]